MERNIARERNQQEVIDWFGKMLECVESLPPDERTAFDKWDGERTGETGTSEWPGFAKYLPPRPGTNASEN